jgi:hypothetical protein
MSKDLTIIIANYMRPENVNRIASEIPKGAKLFIVDNSPNRSLGPTAIGRADWILESSRNNLTTRWYMASQADTPYYCVHDDDLLLRRYDDYVKNTNVLTGPFGVKLSAQSKYIDCYHTETHGDEVEIIKGRMMFGETACLEWTPVPMPPRGLDGDYETIISEDIFISSILGGKFKVTNFNDVVELPAPHASSKTMDHYNRREVARRKMFKI